ncbi:MAG: ABC transporter substrate-binding protein [Acidiferrobacterales bacterium]|nr:ABC transporter substrate-binding protein [Acidiferrobacterales bacterium]
MKTQTMKLRAFALCVLTSVGFAMLTAPAAVRADAELKIGFVTFLSGAAAGPFGVPARNAAELIVESLNKGTVPAPYNTMGIAGATIDAVFVDENSKQKVADYRNLVEKQGVDLVIGYISSGSCKAIAPVVEELRKLTVFFDCGTPQVFEEVVTNPKYLFRTGPHATMDSVGAARYLLKVKPGVKSIAGINQNYAWGQDSWRDFAAAMKVLKPGIEVKTEQFPKIFAGQYGAEISALLTNAADAVHSSFWGGDMEAFVFQAGARGLFKKSQVILTTGETAMHRLGRQMPDGTILGGRGPNGNYAPTNALNDWFRKQYFDRFATWPTYPSYKMAQAILGVKTAYEKAGSGASQEQVIKAFEHLEYDAPNGKVRMAISGGHQAIQDTAYGLYKYDKKTGQGTVTNVQYYKAECVNPPEGQKSLDWINSGFKGAKCG